MFVRAYETLIQDGKVAVGESTSGERIRFGTDPATFFSLLLEGKSPGQWQAQHDRCVRVAWSLDETIAPILKLLGEQKCRRLLETRRCYYPPYNIFYIPGRIFSVTHIPTKNRASLFDLKQYYPELENEYFTLDEVQALGERLLEEFAKMGFYPTSLSSPVGVFEDEILQRLNIPEELIGAGVRQHTLVQMEDALAKPLGECGEWERNLRKQAMKLKSHGFRLEMLGLPRQSSIPEEVAVFAKMCGGSWIEAHQLGYFELAYDFDLSGAYSSIAARLPDFRHCQFVRSREYREDAIMGFVKARISIKTSTVLHPILFRGEDGSLECRTGVWERHCTKSELDFITKWKIGKWEILDGWWVIPPRRLKGGLPEPLRGATLNLLRFKESGGLAGALAKRMSMFWGKFLAEYDERDTVGDFWNPVWAAELETGVRLQVADYLYQNGIGPRSNNGYNHLLHISVDGFLMDCPLKAISGKAPEGRWRESYSGEAMVISSGLVFYGDKHPKGLNLEAIKKAFEEHPRKGYYEWLLKRRVTLADALSSEDGGKFEDLGVEKEMISSIDLYRMTRDRVFKTVPKNGGQLLRQIFAGVPKKVGKR